MCVSIYIMKEIITSNTHSLQDYAEVLGEDIIERLVLNSKDLSTTKIVEINSTPNGGVAELLHSQIPMMRSLGIDASWYVLPENKQFFDTTKELHNCLQGQCSVDHSLDLEFYEDYLREAIEGLPPADLYILHDPQTLGLAKHIKDTPLVWRCHIDTTDAHEPSYKWMSDHFQYFSEIIFSLESFVHKDLDNKINIVQPAIDPLSKKNIKLSSDQIEAMLKELGINKSEQYLLQVSRFDKFKNPLGVLEMYEELHKKLPDLMCVLAGNFPSDDPEGPEYSKEISQKISSLKGNIKVVTKSSDIQINALQSNASVVIQNSTREGFGLTVSEAMWKNKIVFTREVGGITSQIIDKQTGFYLTDDITNNCQSIREVIEHPDRFSKVAQSAHQRVKDKFVLPVMLDDYISVYKKALLS